MPGTLYGLSGPYTPHAAIIWAIYNFVVYALLPFAYFRWRGYSLEQLNLRSNNLRADIVLILIIFVVEATVELLSVSTAIFSLSGRQLLLGAALTFVLNFFGTVLPIMIFIYCILLPRYLKLTNSVALTIILGGLTYAALHVGDSRTNYSSLSNGLLSVIVVIIQYFGPGMVKSVLTLRTGNAWVHVWAYHAIAPHVLIDTPTIVEIFQIRSGRAQGTRLSWRIVNVRRSPWLRPRRRFAAATADPLSHTWLDVTPGPTRVGRPAPPMVGDLAYEVELLDAGRTPGAGNREALRRASAMVGELLAVTRDWSSSRRTTRVRLRGGPPVRRRRSSPDDPGSTATSCRTSQIGTHGRRDEDRHA